jgi:acyl carrier protein
MVPPIFVTLARFPLTATGKVDRRAMPDPNNARPDLDIPFVEPKTTIERDLALIWAEILPLKRVGIHDSFFELGGHSLAAMRVVSRVVQQFQLELPLQSLFQAPTIAAMAAVITEHQGKRLGNEELERMLAELEATSEDEAEQRLADTDKPSSEANGHD